MNDTTHHSRRRIAAAMVAAAVAAALLTACSTGPSAAGPSTETPTAEAPSATEAPAPTAAPTEASTPTPTSSFTADDTSTWPITFTRVGPLTIGGDQKAEATVMTGLGYTGSENQELGQGGTCPADFFYGKGTPQFATTFLPANPDVTTLVAVSGDNSQPISSTVIAASPKTEAGIGIGSTVAALKAAYPGIPKTGAYGDITTYYGLSGENGRWIDFSVGERDEVIGITLADSGIPPSEYCG